MYFSQCLFCILASLFMCMHKWLDTAHHDEYRKREPRCCMQPAALDDAAVASSTDSFNSEQGFGSPLRRHNGERLLLSAAVLLVR